MSKTRKKVAIAMSGGVDSSVAAALLKKQGYDLVGIFMHFWAEESEIEKSIHQFENKCCSLESQEDARKVAEKLGFPFYTLNFAQQFKKEVVDCFLREYGQGRTPNPCIVCNKKIKFDLLLKSILSLKVDYLATGHYVRIGNRKDRYQLLKAKDKGKDQSYFLYNLGQEQLKYLLFPVGKYSKKEVRKLAKKFDLPVAHKKDSQEICFIPEKTHNPFLKRHLKLIKGPIITTEGKKVGQHQGLPLYTIGQRKDIGVGEIGPFYVIGSDYKNNALIVTSNPRDPLLFKKELMIEDVNWISGKEPNIPLKAEVKIRYRHPAVKAILKEKRGNRWLIEFKEAQRAVTPGQSAVIYQGKQVLGGGVIV